jgi:ATP adenylyltransferase
MDRLWTPWRFDYLTKSGSVGECVFCRILAEGRDRDNFVLHRGKSVFLLLNLFPYTSGHMLVAFNRHVPFLADASLEELHECIELARRCEHALKQTYRPEGYNVGLNLGRAAGAGVDQHLHMHVLPRWTGDANFVSVVGETRVLPEDLSRTYDRLLPLFRSAP